MQVMTSMKIKRFAWLRLMVRMVIVTYFLIDRKWAMSDWKWQISNLIIGLIKCLGLIQWASTWWCEGYICFVKVETHLSLTENELCQNKNKLQL